MSGLFQGLEIGKRALLGHQVQMQTIGHNIANVDTPGYSRQRVNISTSLPERSIYGPLGSGMKVDDVTQIRDLFLGKQYREAQKDFGRWTYIDKSLQQVEQIFSEPEDGSLNDLLNDFWNDWSSLATDPENSGFRTTVLADAGRLVDNFQNLAANLEELRLSTDRDLQSMTNQINQMTTEVSRLNHDIKYQELDGSTANDLRDARDLIIDNLSNLIDVNTIDQPDGGATVMMGSMVLVDGSESFDIGVTATTEHGEVKHNIVWANSSYTLKNVSGQLAGLVETRDEIIPGYISKLNDLARTVVEQVNALHSTGYTLDGHTGVNFFDPACTDAANIRINPEVLNNKNRIAASDSSDPDELGNGHLAASLADLRDALIMSGNTVTMNDFYASLVGGLGVDAAQATSQTNNYELITQQVENQRQSVQGVSLDEELTEMVKAQHAYDAAARIITVMDDALDTVIHRMGITG